MKDVFAAPDAAPDEVGDAVDPHLLVARASLALAGVWGLLLAQALGITSAVMPQVDEEFAGVPGRGLVGLALALVTAVPTLAMSFLWLLGAVLLGRGTRAGWFVGLLGHALLVVTCAPVLGIHGLYALLREGAPQ